MAISERSRISAEIMSRYEAARKHRGLDSRRRPSPAQRPKTKCDSTMTMVTPDRIGIPAGLMGIPADGRTEDPFWS